MTAFSALSSRTAFVSGSTLRLTSSRHVSVRSSKTSTVAVLKMNKSAQTLTAGEDIKAQQFDVRLGKDTTQTVTLGFTKSNELFVGRLAMLGFAASLVGEVVTGQGALAQFGLETGIPITDIDGLVLGLVAFNLIAALLPAKGRFVPDDMEAEQRPAGSLQDPTISLLQPKKFFGVRGFGFTKANELFVGRVAQLGFAFSLIGETITGKGALAQIGLETGLPITETEPLLLFFIAFTLFAAVNEGTGKFVDEDAL